MSKLTAAVTMVYNEDMFLPLWRRYYGSQFGETCCYVIDHGSDDGSTSSLGNVNVVRIPRSPMHDKKRANFVSNFCSGLLEWYDSVVYSDVDEFLIPDPDKYSSLSDFTLKLQTGTTVTAIGLNVTHLPDSDPPLDLTKSILGQRQWARFVFSMCKPLVTTVPIRWVPGFHSSDQPTIFDRLYLFHLHHFDLPSSLKRLAKTRSMPWGDGPADHYQRWSDEKHEQVERAIAGFSRIDECSFQENDQVIAPRIAWIKDFVENNPEKRHLFYYNNGIKCEELLRIPRRFFEVI